MIRGRTGSAILLLALLIPAPSALGDSHEGSKPSTVDEIETCIQGNLPTDSSIQEIVLTTVDRIGAENRMNAEIFWQKDEKDRSNVMLRFSDPVEMRGSSLLVLEREPENDLFMYLPELRRTRRVTGRMMAGSVFGTDFSYDEYERLYGLSDDAESELTGEAEVEGRKVWVVESKPDPAGESNHEKVISRVDQERCVPVMVEFFERGDEPRKRLSVDPAQVTLEGKIWVPRNVVMRDLRDGTHTVLAVDDIKLHQKINRKIFSQRELEKGHEPGQRPALLKTYAHFITRHARLVVLLTLALWALSLTRIVDVRTLEPRLFLDPSVNSLLPVGDENRLYYDRIRQIFGSDETLILALHRPDGIFRTDTLETIQRITERLEEMEGVHHVVSLSNAPHMRSLGDDLEIGPLFRTVPDDPGELEALRAEAFDDPLLRQNLLSADATTTGILIYLLEMPESEFTSKELDLRMRDIAEEELAGNGVAWLTGGAHVKSETVRMLIRDLAILIPLAFLAMSIIAAISFRSVRGVVVPMSTVGIGVAWTAAGIAELGQSLNLVTIAVPLLVLVVGFAYAVHVTTTFYEAVQEGPHEGETGSAACRGLAHVALPTLLTGVTTAAGFLSLTTSSLEAIQDFGLYCTIGVVSTMVASLTWAPALLQSMREPAPKPADTAPSRLDAMLESLGGFVFRRRRLILLGGAGVAVLSLLGMQRIQITTDLVSNFDPDADVRVAFEAVNERLSGAGQIYVVLETDYSGAWKEPVNLRLIEELQEWLDAREDIGATTSLTDYVKLIHRGFNDGDPSFHRIPETKSLVTQLLLFGASDEVERFVDSQYQIATVVARARPLDSGDILAMINAIEARLAELPEHVTGRVTGNTALVSKTVDDIAYGQAISLMSAFVIIYLILALLFMSFRVGFMALIPNALPVLFYFGALGWSGVSLNTTTGLVACLVLGIAVDDTIHFFARFNADSKLLGSEEKGVRSAVLNVGRAVTYTSIALCIGFALLGLSSLKNQAEFGLLASVTLAFAWLVDLTFTPALASGMRVVTLWEALTLDLGDHPQEAIPLFRGLSTTQARVAALLTDVVDYPAGHRLIRAGDPAEGMFVVVEGTLQSHLERDGTRVDLNTHQRGDVIGEVGLLQGERSANVDCTSDARLLYIEPEDLQRLERRYPRIAARLFRNLTEVLAGRLVSATSRLGAAGR